MSKVTRSSMTKTTRRRGASPKAPDMPIYNDPQAKAIRNPELYARFNKPQPFLKRFIKWWTE